MKNLREEYLSPEMEKGIAANSARILQGNNIDLVQEIWQEDPDKNQDIEW